MKIVLVSDIHGNYDAWRALPEDYDELWVLGDLVNYGPEPSDVVRDVMDRATFVVQGNHDYAVGHEDDSLWTPKYRMLAETTRRFTSSALNDVQKAYLHDLPLQVKLSRFGRRFHLTHATPSNPLYGRCAPDDDHWTAELEKAEADILLVGHTHVPVMRRVKDKLVLNPGSIGQPRDGRSLASYAVCCDGTWELKTYPYAVNATIAKLQALSLPQVVELEFVNILRTGAV